MIGHGGEDGAQLIGKSERLPREGLFSVHIHVSRSSGDDLDELVIFLQKGAHGGEEAHRAELHPAVAGVGDDEDGAERDGGFEEGEDSALEETEMIGELGGVFVETSVQIGHEAAALQEGGGAAGVVPVENEDGSRVVGGGARAAHSVCCGGDVCENGGEAGAMNGLRGVEWTTSGSGGMLVLVLQGHCWWWLCAG